MTLNDMHGVEECSTDWGKMNCNRANYLNQSNYVEVWLHPTDQQDSMAISPNNGTFLLNMSFPFISFNLVVKSFQE